MICRTVFAAMLLLLLMLGGCAIPRGLGMSWRLDDAAPAPPRSVVTKQTVHTFLAFGNNQSVVDVELHSQLSPEEAIAHYRRALAANRWTEDPKPEHPTDANIHFRRLYTIARDKNSLRVIDEEISIFAQRQEADTLIDITLSGDYLWDKPSEWSTSVVVNVLALIFRDYVVFVAPVVAAPL